MCPKEFFYDKICSDLFLFHSTAYASILFSFLFINEKHIFAIKKEKKEKKKNDTSQVHKVNRKQTKQKIPALTSVHLIFFSSVIQFLHFNAAKGKFITLFI